MSDEDTMKTKSLVLIVIATLTITVGNAFAAPGPGVTFGVFYNGLAGHEPHPRILDDAQAAGLSVIEIVEDPLRAVEGADVVYTDVWPRSNGDAKGKVSKVFKAFHVDAKLLRHAKPDCLVMHRLPANRGEEITSDVLDGSHSVALEQARNRLHVQKGIMSFLRRTTT